MFNLDMTILQYIDWIYYNILNVNVNIFYLVIFNNIKYHTFYVQLFIVGGLYYIIIIIYIKIFIYFIFFVATYFVRKLNIGKISILKKKLDKL